MDRSRIHAREKFEYDQKMSIQAKSGNKCCHCGLEKYPGFGATVDHFIPLNKGGSNEPKNLIMLCEKCNFEKGEQIVEPEEYLKYLEEPYKQEVMDYFNSYLSSYDYFSRGNLLACDRYDFSFFDVRVIKYSNKKVKKGSPYTTNVAMKLILKRASEEDLPYLVTYVQKYFKKFNIPWDFVRANKCIEFWHKFGCIFYTEKDGEINAIFPIILCNYYEENSYVAENTFDKFLYFFPMVYYSTSASGISTASHILRHITDKLAEEQKLQFVPAVYDTFPGDKLLPTVAQYARGSDFKILKAKGCWYGTMATYVYLSDEYLDGTEEEKLKHRKRTAKVFDKLPDRRDDAHKHVLRNKEVEWMLNIIGTFPDRLACKEAKSTAVEMMRIENAKEHNS